MVKTAYKEELPRERLVKYGVSSLSSVELIAIILKTGTKDKNVLELSKNVLQKLEHFHDLQDLTINELVKIHGIGEVKAMELMASIELGFRLSKDRVLEKEKITGANSVYELFRPLFQNKTQEIFYAVYLDQKKKVIAKRALFVGTLNMSIVHPREVFKYAYLNSAASIICVHNHPSGDVTPSIQDIELTKKLKEIGDLQQIYLLDHVIIGNNNYYSFYEIRQVIKWKKEKQ